MARTLRLPDADPWYGTAATDTPGRVTEAAPLPLLLVACAHLEGDLCVEREPGGVVEGRLDDELEGEIAAQLAAVEQSADADPPAAELPP